MFFNLNQSIISYQSLFVEQVYDVLENKNIFIKGDNNDKNNNFVSLTIKTQ